MLLRDSKAACKNKATVTVTAASNAGLTAFERHNMAVEGIKTANYGELDNLFITAKFLTS